MSEPGTRSYFLDDFVDEVTPCDATLEGWAGWLAEPDADTYAWLHAQYPIDGASYKGSAVLWSEDIVAKPHDGRWMLSRDPVDGEDFFAVRADRSAGWSSEDLIYIGDHSTPALDIIMHLVDTGGAPEDDEDIYYIAAGRSEDGWRFTYHEGPPATVTAEREQ